MTGLFSTTPGLDTTHPLWSTELQARYRRERVLLNIEAKRHGLPADRSPLEYFQQMHYEACVEKVRIHYLLFRPPVVLNPVALTRCSSLQMHWATYLNPLPQ